MVMSSLAEAAIKPVATRSGKKLADTALGAHEQRRQPHSKHLEVGIKLVGKRMAYRYMQETTEVVVLKPSASKEMLKLVEGLNQLPARTCMQIIQTALDAGPK